eukprot:525040_1
MQKEEAAAAAPWNNIAVTLLVIIFILFLMLIWMDSRLMWSNEDDNIKIEAYRTVIAVPILVFSLIVLIHSFNRARFSHQPEHKYAVRFEIEMASKLCCGCIKGKYHGWMKNMCIIFCILYDFVTLVSYSFLIALQWMDDDDVFSIDRITMYVERTLLQFSWNIFIIQFGSMCLIHIVCMLFVMVHKQSKHKDNTKRDGYDLFKVNETEKHSQAYWRYTSKWKIPQNMNAIHELDADADTPYPFKGLFGLIVFVLLWCPCFRNALLLFDCDDRNMLVLNPSIECWTSRDHCVLITFAMISVLIQILLGYEYAFKYRNAQFPAFTFVSGYNVTLFTFKVILCLLVSLFCDTHLIVILLLIKISLIMCVCSIAWQPFLGIKPYLNDLNTTFYAASVWCWCSTLYAAVYPQSNLFEINISYVDTFIALPFVCVIVSYLNHYRSIKFVLPSVTYDALKWYLTDCVGGDIEQTNLLKQNEMENKFKHSRCLHQYAMYLLSIDDLSQCDMFLWYAQETSLFAMMLSKDVEVMMKENEEEMTLRQWLAQLISDVGYFYETGLKDHEAAKCQYQRAFELCPYHTDNLKRYVEILAYFQGDVSNVGHAAMDTIYSEISESKIWSHCARPSDLINTLMKTRIPGRSEEN